MFSIRRVGALALGIFLAACGGGGGGESTPAVTFEPAALIETADAGVSKNVTLVVRPTFTTSNTVHVQVIDTVGVITPDVVVTPQAGGVYTVRLTISPNLSAQRYTGSIEVRLCPVADCSQQFGGSPVRLPYDIDAGGLPRNETPLMRDAAIPEWGTHQGGALHAGHVPVTVDASRITFRWRWTSTSGNVGPVVTENDMVYLVSSSGAAGAVLALREQDADIRWSVGIGPVHAVNPPAVSGGAVFVATSGHADTAMWSFDGATGALRFRTPFQSQFDRYYAPTIAGTMVYTNGGYTGGLQAFDRTSGAATWFTPLGISDQWTPAVDGAFAYATTAGHLTVLDRTTGAEVSRTALSGYVWNGYTSDCVPIPVTGGRVLTRSSANISGNALNLVDPTAGAVVWAVPGVFVTDPVVVSDTVYIANSAPMQLEARRLSDGGLLWSWPLISSNENAFFDNLIATDSHVFISTNRKTYAINRTTRQSQWSFAATGHKAISPNGVLYISTKNPDWSSDQGLTAFNLR